MHYENYIIWRNVDEAWRGNGDQLLWIWHDNPPYPETGRVDHPHHPYHKRGKGFIIHIFPTVCLPLLFALRLQARCRYRVRPGWTGQILKKAPAMRKNPIPGSWCPVPHHPDSGRAGNAGMGATWSPPIIRDPSTCFREDTQWVRLRGGSQRWPVVFERIRRADMYLKNAEIRQITHLNRHQVTRLMNELMQENPSLKKDGKNRASQYFFSDTPT